MILGDLDSRFDALLICGGLNVCVADTGGVLGLHLLRRGYGCAGSARDWANIPWPLLRQALNTLGSSLRSVPVNVLPKWLGAS